MRKLLFVIVLGAVLAIASPAAAATVTVALNRSGFTPSTARITTGDTVTWTNSDTRNRQVISSQAGFASPILAPGETFSYTFRRAGRFAYEEALVEPTQKGTVVVTAPATPPPPPAPPAPAGTITLGASQTTVVYGGSVVLTGELSAGTSGEVVEVLSQPTGSTATVALTKVAETTTGAGGEFRVAVKPQVGTSYRVRWKTTTSGRVTIAVRPRVGLGVVSVARGVFTTKATATRSYAGRVVLFQRLGRFGQWVTLKRVRLSELDSARFTARLPKGVSRVRVYMPPAQAGPGYLAGISPTRLVRR